MNHAMLHTLTRASAPDSGMIQHTAVSLSLTCGTDSERTFARMKVPNSRLDLYSKRNAVAV